MNDYIVKYEKDKKNTINLLNKVEKFYLNEKMNSESKVVNDLATLLFNNDFCIVIAGEFSVGKSTFINALLGEKILPSFTSETTATLNFIRHSSKAKNNEFANVHYNDKTIKNLKTFDIDILSEYCSTKSSINVAKEVKCIDIYYDSKFLKNNITIVDTPGLNGIAEHHFEMTLSQIERANVCVYMFSADRPGSSSDFNFISKLKNKNPKITFVLNKIDEIKSIEKETKNNIISSIKDNYKKYFDEIDDINIIGVSAYQALISRSKSTLDYRGKLKFSEQEKKILLERSNINEFEDWVVKYIIEGEKAKNQIITPIQKTLNLVEYSLRSLELYFDIYKISENFDDINNKIVEIEDQKIKQDTKFKAILLNIESRLDLSRTDIKDFIQEKCEYFKENLLKNLNILQSIIDVEDLEKNIITILKFDLHNLFSTIKTYYLGIISKIIDHYSKDYHESIMSKINEIEFEKIDFEIKHSTSESGFVLGIEEYQNEINELNEKIYKLQSEIDINDLEIINVVNIEKEVKKISDVIASINASKSAFELELEKPKIERVYKKEINEHAQKGIIGFFKKITTKKVVLETIEHKDDTEVLKWKEETESKRKQFNDDILFQKQLLSNYDYSGPSSAELEKIQTTNLKNLQLLQNNLDTKRQDFKERYIKENIALFIKKKSLIEGLYHDAVKTYKSQIYTSVKKHMKNSIIIINDIIKNELAKDLNIKNNSLEILKTNLHNSQEDKDKNTLILSNQINELSNLKNELSNYLNQVLNTD